jgi:CRISPR-associated protein Cas2
MAASKRWRLICYDIRDPGRWRDVYRIVTGHGTRVQYSIYRARLDDQQVEQLRWELSRVMDPADALLIVDLCPSCAGNVISKNHVTGWQDPVSSFRVIGGSSGTTIEQGSLDGDDDVAREFHRVEENEPDPDL